MGDEECHFIYEHNINFQSDMPMYRENVCWYWSDASFLVRIWPLYSLAFEAALICPKDIVGCSDIRYFKGTTLKMREYAVN